MDIKILKVPYSRVLDRMGRDYPEFHIESHGDQNDFKIYIYKREVFFFGLLHHLHRAAEVELNPKLGKFEGKFEGTCKEEYVEALKPFFAEVEDFVKEREAPEEMLLKLVVSR